MQNLDPLKKLLRNYRFFQNMYRKEITKLKDLNLVLRQRRKMEADRLARYFVSDPEGLICDRSFVSDDILIQILRHPRTDNDLSIYCVLCQMREDYEDYGPECYLSTIYNPLGFENSELIARIAYEFEALCPDKDDDKMHYILTKIKKNEAAQRRQERVRYIIRQNILKTQRFIDKLVEKGDSGDGGQTP